VLGPAPHDPLNRSGNRAWFGDDLSDADPSLDRHGGRFGLENREFIARAAGERCLPASLDANVDFIA
jgi:hypothetical protein